MTSTAFQLARESTKQAISDNRISHHMFHGPATDEYWCQKSKIAIVNLESYGYQECGLVNVDYGTLHGWMLNINRRIRTVRNSVALASVILKGIRESVVISESELAHAYRDTKRLEATLRVIAYYNINGTSNSVTQQNLKMISKSGDGAVGACVGKEILSLDANIILVSGRGGCDAINSMLGLSGRLSYLSSTEISNSLTIFSIRHPSRPKYVEYARVAKDACLAVAMQRSSNSNH